MLARRRQRSPPTHAYGCSNVAWTVFGGITEVPQVGGLKRCVGRASSRLGARSGTFWVFSQRWWFVPRIFLTHELPLDNVCLSSTVVINGM